MPTIAMSGSDTVVINNRSFVDFADGNVVELTFPNDIANVKTGKNGNSIYGLNESGKQCEVKLRLVRASSDDNFMNGLLSAQQLNFAGTVLLSGQFIKKIGDGQGGITSDTYVLGGGIFVKQVEGKTNVEGDTEQSISIYTMKFSNSPRAIT
jgi:hypothetical protein